MEALNCRYENYIRALTGRGMVFVLSSKYGAVPSETKGSLSNNLTACTNEYGPARQVREYIRIGIGKILLDFISN